MSKRPKATCGDCYFRTAGLCALPGETICPTFRTATAGTMTPPKQAPLLPRPLAGHATA
jgi:hypothetical protein